MPRNQAMLSRSSSRLTKVVVAISGTIGMVIAAGGSSMDSHAQANLSIWDGIYTEAQAARGGAVFGDQCAVCHGNPPVGASMGPPLIGDDFLAGFKDSNVEQIFTKISTTMPANDPGTLKPAEVTDVVAFLAMSNKWPAGEKELSSDLDVLKRIQIAKK